MDPTATKSKIFLSSISTHYFQEYFPMTFGIQSHILAWEKKNLKQINKRGGRGMGEKCLDREDTRTKNCWDVNRLSYLELYGKIMLLDRSQEFKTQKCIDFLHTSLTEHVSAIKYLKSDYLLRKKTKTSYHNFTQLRSNSYLILLTVE